MNIVVDAINKIQGYFSTSSESCTSNSVAKQISKTQCDVFSRISKEKISQNTSVDDVFNPMHLNATEHLERMVCCNNFPVKTGSDVPFCCKTEDESCPPNMTLSGNKKSCHLSEYGKKLFHAPKIPAFQALVDRKDKRNLTAFTIQAMIVTTAVVITVVLYYNAKINRERETRKIKNLIYKLKNIETFA